MFSSNDNSHHHISGVVSKNETEDYRHQCNIGTTAFNHNGGLGVYVLF